MGSVVSQEVYDTLEEDPNQSPNSKSSVRTLPSEFDPRSPTVGVDRTPIQFAASPDLLIDPRSPSYGIDRTPIYPTNVLDGSSVDVVSVAEIDEPTRQALVVPFNLMDADEDSGTLGGTTDVLVPVPVAPIIDFSDSVLQQSMDFKEAEEPEVLTSAYAEVMFEILKPRTAKAPQCDLPKMKAMPRVTPFCPSSQRSPLGTRNILSGNLRSMVQLKEARKVENMRNSPADSLRLRNKGSFVDKENL